MVDQHCQKFGYWKNLTELSSLAALDADLPPRLTEAVEQGRKRDYAAALNEVLADLRAPVSEHSLPSPDAPALSDTFSEREIEILRLIAEGLNSREAAQRLHLAVSTIRWYRHQIYVKLDAHSRSQALARARGLKLL